MSNRASELTDPEVTTVSQQQEAKHGPREIRWSWQSRDNDLRVGYMAVDGRISIPELIAHMRTVAPGVELEDMQINWATVTWTRPANAEELARRKMQLDRQQERHEAWERETLVRLTEKYKR